MPAGGIGGVGIVVAVGSVESASMRGRPLRNLRRLRVDREWSLRRLHAISGVHYTRLSALENLKQGADPITVGRLARAFEVSEEELVGEGG